MNLYLFHPEEFNTIYNCTNIRVEDVPLEERTHQLKDYLLLFRAVCFTSCMFLVLLLCTNTSTTLAIGFVHGYWSMIGAVYCSYPNLIYLAGVAVTNFRYSRSWMAESASQIFLAINRCMSILCPRLEKKILAVCNWF
uniref:Uncharacterized protein n=1 Tax=Ditylenchus dipsaci TaxID=166011 RepID=A0A915CY35_9BILA